MAKTIRILKLFTVKEVIIGVWTDTRRNNKDQINRTKFARSMFFVHKVNLMGANFAYLG